MVNGQWLVTNLKVSKAGTGNQKPGTRNQKPETRNPKPETRNQNSTKKYFTNS